MNTFDNGFEGYLSVWKSLGWFAFLVWALVLLAFGRMDDFTGYKWLFSPMATPLRAILAVVLVYFLFWGFRIMLTSLSGKPVISVKGDIVTMRYGKYGQFSIADIDEVGTLFNGDYFLRVSDRKYGLSLIFCKNSDALRLDMEALQQFVYVRREQ